MGKVRCIRLFYVFVTGGVEIDDDAVVDALVGLGLGDLGAEDVDLDHVGVVSQEGDGADLGVVVHVDIVQGADLVQGFQGRELVVGAVDGDQGGIGRQRRQGRGLIVGEVELRQLGQGTQHGDVRDQVVADVQGLQLGADRQGCAVGDLVFLGPEGGQGGELLNGGDVGELVLGDIQTAQLGAGGQGRDAGDHIFTQIQLRQLCQGRQGSEVGDGVVPEVQDLQGGDPGQHAQIADGVGGQVQLLQAGRTLQEGQGADGAAAHGQLLQSRQSLQDGQVRADGTAGEVQGLQTGHALQEAQIGDGPVGEGEIFQIPQMPQVAQFRGRLGDGQGGDGPQIVGVDGSVLAEHQLVLDQLLDVGVCKFHGLDDAAHGVAQNGQGTDQTVAADSDGVDLRLAALESHGGDAGGIGGGGVLAVGGDVEGAAVSGEIQADVLAVEAGGEVGRGGRRAQGVQLGLDGRVGHLVEHVYRVEQLVLLHIGLAQGDVQLAGGTVGDGADQSPLGLGVVAGVLVDLGQVNGHIFVLAGKFIGNIIEPGGRLEVAVLGAAPGLGHQKIPYGFPVVDEDVPDCAGDQGHDQQKRDDPFDDLFHKDLLPFRV